MPRSAGKPVNFRNQGDAALLRSRKHYQEHNLRRLWVNEARGIDYDLARPATIRSVESDMEPQRKGKPAGMCPICHLAIPDTARVGSQCPSRQGNYRCTGIFKDTTQANDWKACAPCDATGMIEGAPCRHCRGVGWIFVRPGGFDHRQPPGMPIIGHLF